MKGSFRIGRLFSGASRKPACRSRCFERVKRRGRRARSFLAMTRHPTLEFRFRVSYVRQMRSSRCRRVVAKSRRRYTSSIRDTYRRYAVSGPEAAGRLMQSGGARFRDIDARKRQCDAATGASREQKRQHRVASRFAGRISSALLIARIIAEQRTNDTTRRERGASRALPRD